MRRGRRTARYYLSAILGIPVLVLLLPVLLVVLPAIGLYRWAEGHVLAYRFRRTWGAKGKIGILVYSESPNWKEYIETTLLPRVADRMVTLNWSRRSEWREDPPLEVRLFRHWAGSRAFNPMAIVVPARGRVQTIRFWDAFRDFKHGKAEGLRTKEIQLLEKINAAV